MYRNFYYDSLPPPWPDQKLDTTLRVCYVSRCFYMFVRANGECTDDELHVRLVVHCWQTKEGRGVAAAPLCVRRDSIRVEIRRLNFVFAENVVHYRAGVCRPRRSSRVSGRWKRRCFWFFQRWRMIEIEVHLAIRTDGRDLLYVPGITFVPPRRQTKSVKIFSRLRL